MGGTSSIVSSSKVDCCTDIEITKYHFTWNIKNLSFRIAAGDECLQSPVFSVGDDGDSKWCLRLRPNGGRVGNMNRISLFLRLVSSKKNEVCVRVTLRLLPSEKLVYTEFRFDHIYKSENEDFASSLFVQRRDPSIEINNLFPEDQLTVSAEIYIVGKEYSTIKTTYSSKIVIPQSSLPEHLETLYESQELKDVVVCSKRKEFHCHKAILAARSPVFLAMFKHKTKESIQNRIEIPDMDDKVLEDLLRFIYTSKAPAAENLTKDLLAAADKYDVQRLKIMCEDQLSRTLSIQTAAELLGFSDKYNAVNLKSLAIQFIMSNAIPVLKTKEWENVVKEQPDLIIEVSRCLDGSKVPGS